MRTVYSTAIGLTSEDDTRSAMNQLSAWVAGWYKRRGIVFVAPSFTEPGSHAVEPADRHQLRSTVFARAGDPHTRLLELDWHYPDDYDRGLAWSIRIRMLSAPGSTIFALQLGILGTRFLILPASIKLGPPRIVRSLTSLPTATLAGYPYDSHPQLLRADAVEAFCGSLLDPMRSVPVVLVSRDLASERPLVEVDRLASGLAGLMRVYELSDKWAAFRLTEELGKAFSCYAGATRVYWPGLSLRDDPFKHPSWMPWRLKELRHTDDLSSQLFALGAEASAFRLFEPPEIASFRRQVEDEERATRRTQSSADSERLLEDLIDTEDKLRKAEADLDELRSENRTLRENLSAMAGAPSPSLEAPQDPVEDDGSDEPGSVADAVAAARQQATHSEFLPSALESARSSPYRTPTRALQALQAIEEVARLWAAGLAGGRNPGPIRALFRDRGFDYKDDISQTSRNKWGGEYVATYNGQEVDISPHITIGAKQADTCLSIHMHWDKPTRKVVIAHVGRHKTNTKT